VQISPDAAATAVSSSSSSMAYRCKLPGVTAPLLKAGSALLYDYRTVHRCVHEMLMISGKKKAVNYGLHGLVQF
jgi:hypothetical protein